MLKYDEADVDQAIADTYEDPELKTLAELWDGMDDPFYSGLRVAFAYQQLKLDEMKSRIDSASKALESVCPETWVDIVKEARQILKDDL